ncbi:MAG: glycosyltransferase family 2 protein, partial [bacterium]|nr:glycosyltransferase family 2 protein [bacterium]
NRNNFSLLLSDKNLGFAGAINRAAKETPADAFLILNPDIDLGGDTVLRLARTLERNQSVALVAPVLINSDRTPQTGFMARRLPTPTLLILELFGIHKIWKNNPWSSWHRYSPSLELSLLTDRVEKSIFDWQDQPVDIEQPAGACMLICAKVFNELGGMDESFYPAWFEDVDLCKRLKNAGQRCCIIPDAIAIHRGGATLDSMPKKKFQAIFLNNMLLYSRKHFSKMPAMMMELLIPLAWLIRCVLLPSRESVAKTIEGPPAKITLS